MPKAHPRPRRAAAHAITAPACDRHSHAEALCCVGFAVSRRVAKRPSLRRLGAPQRWARSLHATRRLKLATENISSAASRGMRQDRQQATAEPRAAGRTRMRKLVCHRQRQSMSERVRPTALGRLQGRCGSTWRRRRSGVPPSRTGSAAGSAAWCVASCVFACGVLCVDPARCMRA